MNVTNVKLACCAGFLVAVLVIISVTGFTTVSTEGKGGVMIDYGYYNVDWTENGFSEDMDAVEALESVCKAKGYELEFDEDGNVCSVNGYPNLQRGMEWGFYVLEEGKWAKVSHPSGYGLDGQKIVCWARAVSAEDVMPATDTTGYIYYDYAKNGKVQGEDVRLVSLGTSVTETLVAAGGAPYLVGVTNDSAYAFDLVKAEDRAERIGSSTIPNYEKIVSVSPDVVFLDGSMDVHTDIADKLRKSGIHCVLLYGSDDIGNIFRNIWICSSAIGFSEKGNEYMGAMNVSVSSVGNIFSGGGRVFIAYSTDTSAYTAGSGTYLDSMLKTIGLTNVFTSPGTYKVSPEEVFAQQPDIIVVMAPDVNVDSQRGYRSVMASVPELWKDTPAYRNGSVYVFSGKSADLLEVAGPRVTSAIELVSKVIDPESFRKFFPSDKVYNYFGDSYRDYLIYQHGGLMT
ncbi:MAG: ABC transporter substrate-binding protein [archaeon]|nr:ABC transporter substrate-binding protein [archaeon]